MISILKHIQDILLSKKHKELDSLGYKEYRHTGRPTELEQLTGIDYFSHIDKPYDNSSEATKQELQQVIDLSTGLSQSIINTILLIDKDPLTIYKHILDKHSIVFPQEEFNTLYAILYPMIVDLKLFFNRPRPNQIAEFYNLSIDVLHTDTHHTPSYPSGHTAYAVLAELLLSEKYPHLASEFHNATQKVMLARIKQGVHFDSDNQASVKLVNKIFDSLIQHVARQ